MGVRRRGKTGKHGKVGVEKVVGFNPASLFPEKKREAITQGGTRGKTTCHGREPREPVSSKAGRTSKTAGTFQILACKTRITRAQAP